MADTATEDRRRLDRRRTHRFAYPERRTGFDRRAPRGGRLRRAYEEMLLWYRKNPRAILLVLAIITALNLGDLLFTQRALVRGADEINPVMRFLFDLDPVWAAVVKASIGMIVVEVMWALRRYRSALVLSVMSAIGMGLLLGYHLVTQRIVPI